MKILDLSYERISFSDFADKHGLTLEIRERPLSSGLHRYYASFVNTEVADGGCLVGTLGNGNTKDEAIAAYADRLRGWRIVVGAWTPARREIQCPNEWA